jgi:hypothetical protein
MGSKNNAAKSARRRPSRCSALCASGSKATLLKLSRKSETTVAIRYPLSRWHALARYIEDGHIEIDNNAANALCPA